MAFQILHLAMPLNAFCISGERQIGLQTVCTHSRSFPRLILQVVAGMALVVCAQVAASRWSWAAGIAEHPWHVPS